MSSPPTLSKEATGAMQIGFLILVMLAMAASLVYVLLEPMWTKHQSVLMVVATIAFLEGLLHLQLHPAADGPSFSKFRIAYWLLYAVTFCVILARWIGA